MKVKDLLSVAGEYPLEYFTWGEGLIKKLRKEVPGFPAEVTEQSTGDQALAILEDAKETMYKNPLEIFVDMQLVDYKPPMSPLRKAAVGLVTGIVIIGVSSFAYETFKTGQMPASQMLVDLSKILLELFSF